MPGGPRARSEATSGIPARPDFESLGVRVAFPFRTRPAWCAHPAPPYGRRMATTEIRDDIGESADAATTLLLRFMRVAHGAGYPTADLEERIRALAAALGLTPVQVSATPTLVEVSIGALRRQRTFTIRVHPMDADLAAIARLDDLLQDVVAQRAGAAEALDAIATTPERPWPITLIGYAALPAALTPVLGGTWREAVASALVWLLISVLALTFVFVVGFLFVFVLFV